MKMKKLRIIGLSQSLVNCYKFTLTGDNYECRLIASHSTYHKLNLIENRTAAFKRPARALDRKLQSKKNFRFHVISAVFIVFIELLIMFLFACTTVFLQGNTPTENSEQFLFHKLIELSSARIIFVVALFFFALLRSIKNCTHKIVHE